MSGNAHQRRQHRRHPETVRRHDGPQVITIPLREFVREPEKPELENLLTETLRQKLHLKLREVALLAGILGLTIGATIYRIFFW